MVLIVDLESAAAGQLCTISLWVISSICSPSALAVLPPGCPTFSSLCPSPHPTSSVLPPSLYPWSLVLPCPSSVPYSPTTCPPEPPPSSPLPLPSPPPFPALLLPALQPNHLSGLQRQLLKLSFWNVQALMEVGTGSYQLTCRGCPAVAAFQYIQTIHADARCTHPVLSCPLHNVPIMCCPAHCTLYPFFCNHQGRYSK